MRYFIEYKLVGWNHWEEMIIPSSTKTEADERIYAMNNFPCGSKARMGRIEEGSNDEVPMPDEC